VIWAVLLVVIALAVPGAWAWYLTGRQRAATTDAQRWPLVRHASMVSAGVGVAILALGVAAFVITGYDWLVLALLWAFGVPHRGLLAATYRRSRKNTGLPGPSR
jgi:hypothetical protein